MAPDLPRVLDATVLDRYLAGECSEVECAAVEGWLAADPGRPATIRALRFVLSGEVSDGCVDADEELRRLKGLRVRTPLPSSIRPPGRWDGVRRRTRLPNLWYALGMLVVGAVGLVLGRKAAAPGAHTAAGPTALATYSTANGQRANITLPDGSVVVLNVASRLEVPADYAVGNRVLRLSGEALFTVRHRPGAPFTVIAGGTAARVLGTTFSVRHYVADSSTIVAVRDGKVGVHSVVLTAARLAEVLGNGAVRVRPATPSQFGFATGVLTINDLPFQAAIVELDRWYDADIRLGDPALAAARVTGEYGSGSLAELADILAGTFNVRVVRDGRVLTLYPR